MERLVQYANDHGSGLSSAYQDHRYVDQHDKLRVDLRWALDRLSLLTRLESEAGEIAEKLRNWPTEDCCEGAGNFMVDMAEQLEKIVGD